MPFWLPNRTYRVEMIVQPLSQELEDEDGLEGLILEVLGARGVSVHAGPVVFETNL